MAVVIRLLGLPFIAGPVDIRHFFTGLTIPDGGVHIIGGDVGEAFIIFATDEDARRAVSRSGGFIKNSSVELFLSSRAEMQKTIEMKRTDRVGRGRPGSRTSGVGGLSDFVEAVEEEENKSGYGSSVNQDARFHANGTGRGDPRPKKTRPLKAENPYLFLRGLPYLVNEDDVRVFFSGLCVDGVIFLKHHDGRNNGDAIVKFASCIDASGGLKCHRSFMGSRFIEVMQGSERQWIELGGDAVQEDGVPASSDEHSSARGTDRHFRKRSHPESPRTRSRSPLGFYVHLKNLSLSINKKDLRNFFRDTDLTNEQIRFLYKDERRTRYAFVMFKTLKDYNTALTLHKTVLQYRPVLVDPISRKQMLKFIEYYEKKRPGLTGKERSGRVSQKNSQEGSSGQKLCIYMRNFPFDVTKVEIQKFFADFSLAEDDIYLLYDDKGVGLGEALVRFQSEEQAMKAERLNRRRFLGTEVLLRLISEAQMQEFEVNVMSGEKTQSCSPAHDRDDRPHVSGSREAPAYSFGSSESFRHPQRDSQHLPEDFRRSPENFRPSPEDFRHRREEDFRRSREEDWRRPDEEDWRWSAEEEEEEEEEEDFGRLPEGDFRRPPEEDLMPSWEEDSWCPPEDSFSQPREENFRRPPHGEWRRAPEEEFRQAPEEDSRRPPEEDFRRSPGEEVRRSPPDHFRRSPLDHFRRPPQERFRRPPPEHFRRAPPEHCRRAPPPEHCRRAPTPEHCRRAPPPEHCRRAPTPEHCRRAPPPEHSRRARTPEHCRRAPPLEHCRRAPTPEHCRRAPTPEHCRRAPPPEHCRRAPPPEHCRRAPPPEHSRRAPPEHCRRAPTPEHCRRAPPEHCRRAPPEHCRRPPQEPFRRPPPEHFRRPREEEFRHVPDEDFRDPADEDFGLSPDEDFRSPQEEDFRHPSDEDFRQLPEEDLRDGPEKDPGLPEGGRPPGEAFRSAAGDFRSHRPFVNFGRPEGGKFDFGKQRSVGGFPEGRFIPDPKLNYGSSRGTPIKIMNLPFKANVNEILDFFHGYRVITDSVSIQYNEQGLPTGEAIVTMINYNEAMAAIKDLNDRPVGPRKVKLMLL